MSETRRRDSGTALSRRHWITGMAALTAAVVGRPSESAQRTPTRPYKLDTHHHHSQGGPWTPSRSLEAMDRNGIAAAILSRPATSPTDLESARKAARDANDFGAQVVRDNPARFGLFATLPMADVDGALREIAYAYDVLKADGVCCTTSYGNRWLGDPMFAPIFEELNRRNGVVFVHPSVPGFYTEELRLQSKAVGEPGLQPAALEFMFDIARSVVSLILNGTLYKTPRVRFIHTHGGGALPLIHERLQHLIGEDKPPDPEFNTGDNRFRSKYVPDGFLKEMGKVYFDMVRVANPPNFALLKQVMPANRLVIGTDYPIVQAVETVGKLGRLGMDAKTLRAVERDNLLELFPRFKTT